MELTFENLNKILPLFANVKELILCNNNLSDTHHFNPKQHLKNLEFLNLENNSIEDFKSLNE